MENHTASKGRAAMKKVLTGIKTRIANKNRPAHKILFTPDILERILLTLDMRTLLLSKRVCRMWNDLIDHSPKLQAALFFQPIPETEFTGERHIPNPLIVDEVWPRYFRRTLNSRHRPAQECLCLPKVQSLQKEKAYLRPEASWRRMLLHQPPTSRVAFFTIIDFIGGPDYCYASWKPIEDCIRLMDLEIHIDSGALVPSTEAFFLWSDVRGALRTRKRDIHLEDVEPAVNQCLGKCDFIVYTMAQYLQFLNPKGKRDGFSCQFDRWAIESHAEIVRCSSYQSFWSIEKKRLQRKKFECRYRRKENEILALESSDEDDSSDEEDSSTRRSCSPYPGCSVQ
ncbi:hypothetical protein BDV25DRAFT_147072 [Aspergillus avenaceus]|uniref:F-box domain-containing protein n=1 Tax=Aspergillus avenaceus TaxID=36643 RepID=A0A5N6U8T7_ASPAV|nr:hypothetical protein BDV25DRAFT_147072 [Aspergillus avenaceus]